MPGVSSRNIPRMIRRIAEVTKALGLMVKGQAPFNDEAARAALAQIERHLQILSRRLPRMTPSSRTRRGGSSRPAGR